MILPSNMTVSDPKEFTVRNVQYYCAETKQLKNSQISKAKKFIQNGCIVKSGNDYFIKPLTGYNSTTYHVKNGISCNCQGFTSKKKRGEFATCSHILAITYYKKIRGIL